MEKAALFSVILGFCVAGVFASQRYDDLAKLVKSGASEEVLLAYINTADSSYDLSADEIVQLKTYGAAPGVIIAAIQHKGNASVGPKKPAAPEETASTVPGPSTVYRVAPPWGPRRMVRTYWYAPDLGKMTHALQVDMAGLMSGTMTLNYEYLVHHEFGIVLEGSYSTGWGSYGEDAILACRWHWAKSMNSGFLGVFVKGGRFYGNENDLPGETSPAYVMTSVTIGPDIGKRWVYPWGLSVVGRVGFGYTRGRFDNAVPDERTIDRLRAGTGFDSEISVGYAF